MQTITLGSGTAPAALMDDPAAVDQFFARPERPLDAMAHALGHRHLGHHGGGMDFGDLLLDSLIEV